jgi:hypothetical protein
MALHHFIWQGKERAVALNRGVNDRILLDFVDDDIIQHVSPRIVLANEKGLVNEAEIISKEAAAQLLRAIEEGIGKPMTTWSKNSIA